MGKKPTVLMILDGYGLNEKTEGNAVAQGKTPVMDRLMAERTTLVIAHRLSTVRNANAIMVLENGVIIERGDHDDLLAQKGRYYELYTGLSELDERTI